MRYVINPKTQRLIQVGKPTYKRLIKEKVITKRTPVYEFKEEKKMYMPRKKAERDEIRKRCGSKCFLKYPDKYHICEKTRTTCKTSCPKLKRALRLAHIHKNDKVLKSAIHRIKRKCKSQN